MIHSESECGCGHLSCLFHIPKVSFVNRHFCSGRIPDPFMSWLICLSIVKAQCIIIAQLSAYKSTAIEEEPVHMNSVILYDLYQGQEAEVH